MSGVRATTAPVAGKGSMGSSDHRPSTSMYQTPSVRALDFSLDSGFTSNGSGAANDATISPWVTPALSGRSVSAAVSARYRRPPSRSSTGTTRGGLPLGTVDPGLERLLPRRDDSRAAFRASLRAVHDITKQSSPVSPSRRDAVPTPPAVPPVSKAQQSDFLRAGDGRTCGSPALSGGPPLGSPVFVQRTYLTTGAFESDPSMSKLGPDADTEMVRSKEYHQWRAKMEYRMQMDAKTRDNFESARQDTARYREMLATRGDPCSPFEMGGTRTTDEGDGGEHRRRSSVMAPTAAPVTAPSRLSSQELLDPSGSVPTHEFAGESWVSGGGGGGDDGDVDGDGGPSLPCVVSAASHSTADAVAHATTATVASSDSPVGGNQARLVPLDAGATPVPNTAPGRFHGGGTYLLPTNARVSGMFPDSTQPTTPGDDNCCDGDGFGEDGDSDGGGIPAIKPLPLSTPLSTTTKSRMWGTPISRASVPPGYSPALQPSDSRNTLVRTYNRLATREGHPPVSPCRTDTHARPFSSTGGLNESRRRAHAVAPAHREMMLQTAVSRTNSAFGKRAPKVLRRSGDGDAGDRLRLTTTIRGPRTSVRRNNNKQKIKKQNNTTTDGQSGRGGRTRPEDTLLECVVQPQASVFTTLSSSQSTVMYEVEPHVLTSHNPRHGLPDTRIISKRMVRSQATLSGRVRASLGASALRAHHIQRHGYSNPVPDPGPYTQFAFVPNGAQQPSSV